MPILKPPAPPAGIGNCASCVKWCGEPVKVVTVNAAQAVPYDDYVQAKGIPPADIIKRMAQCTNQPAWAFMTSDHWCWQFVPRQNVSILPQAGNVQTKN